MKYVLYAILALFLLIPSLSWGSCTYASNISGGGYCSSNCDVNDCSSDKSSVPQKPSSCNDAKIVCLGYSDDYNYWCSRGSSKWYGYICSTQAEADSIACVQDGKDWVNSQCQEPPKCEPSETQLLTTCEDTTTDICVNTECTTTSQVAAHKFNFDFKKCSEDRTGFETDSVTHSEVMLGTCEDNKDKADSVRCLLYPKTAGCDSINCVNNKMTWIDGSCKGYGPGLPVCEKSGTFANIEKTYYTTINSNCNLVNVVNTYSVDSDCNTSLISSVREQQLMLSSSCKGTVCTLNSCDATNDANSTFMQMYVKKPVRMKNSSISCEDVWLMRGVKDYKLIFWRSNEAQPANVEYITRIRKLK